VTEGDFKPMQEARTTSQTIRDYFGLAKINEPTHDKYVKEAVIKACAELLKEFFANVRW